MIFMDFGTTPPTVGGVVLANISMHRLYVSCSVDNINRLCRSPHVSLVADNGVYFPSTCVIIVIAVEGIGRNKHTPPGSSRLV